MTTKPKSQAGVIAGNMIIDDFACIVAKGAAHRPYTEKQISDALDAVQTDQENADYYNRVYIRNFLQDIVSRGKIALVEIQRTSYVLGELCIRLQAKMNLDLKPKQVYCPADEYLKTTKEKLELYYKGADGQEKATTLLPFALEYLNQHISKYAMGYGQPLNAQEIAYFREVEGLDMSDNGVMKPTEAQRNWNDYVAFAREISTEIPDDLDKIKERIDRICAYWKDPKTIQTSAGKQSYTYTKDELLPHLERYIEYLRNKGDTNAIKSTLEHFSKAIQDSIAHIQNKALQIEIKRLSALDLATKEYHLSELAEYYGVDFTAQAWGDVEILISTQDKYALTADKILKEFLYTERPQKLEFIAALESMEAHLEFLRGYNLMITLLQEFTGAQEMKELLVNIDEMEAKLKACYKMIATLAQQCIITGLKEVPDDSKIQVEIIKHALLETKKQTESKNSLEERKKQLKELLALVKKHTQEAVFTQIQEKFFAVAMGVYYQWEM